MAYQAVTAATAGASASGVRVDGVLISPMRRGGAELLAGVVRDPQRSLVLAIGGLFIEVLQDSALGPLRSRPGGPVICSAVCAAGPYWTASPVPRPSAWIRYPR